jgi:hypothetical protein
MHTLYVAAHGTLVALGAYVTDLQRRLEIAIRRREPIAERPTALEITAAQGKIARFAGFEQLAAAYMFGQALPSADPGQLRAAAPATRLKIALAAWEIQAHRSLASPDPADLVRVGRVRALITSTTSIVTEAAATKGQILTAGRQSLVQSKPGSDKGLNGGRYWVRTSDLFGVKHARCSAEVPGGA